MTRETDYSIPPAVRRIAGSFRLVGWISFWIQVVLGVVAGGILLFASATFGARSGDTSNPGTGTGLILASLGLIAVFVSAFWSFRYAQLGRRLRSRDASKRPSPKDALQALRIGLIISMVGMLVTLMGGQALIGSLLGKALIQPQGGRGIYPRQYQSIRRSVRYFHCAGQHQYTAGPLCRPGGYSMAAEDGQ